MPPENNAPNPNQPERDAAVIVVRDQLDAIYDNNQPAATTPAPSAQPQQARPHAQSMTQSNQANHWQQYHDQWQDYYQKYYERYYVGHLHQELDKQAKSKQTPQEQRDEAIVDLRQKIVTNAKTSAKKARKSRHFIPIASAFAMVLIVAFLQYNEVLFANVQAYVSPGAIDPQNIVVDPTANVQVAPDPKLIIPKINVNVPVAYGVGYDQKSQLAAMEKG